MSSAKPTPRYVQRIPPPNIHLVGPSAAQVIPIRRVTPAYVPVVEMPAKPAPRRAARFVPVERRAWLVLLVPPTPGARTRSFGVARWQARVVVASLALLLLMTGAAAAAIIGAIPMEDLFVTSADAAQLRERLAAVEDSLSMARAELATDEEVSGDALFDALPAAAIPMPADASPATTAASRKALLSRSSRANRSGGDAEAAALPPRSMEGLPVIGRLSSGFSRTRRHPVLHIRRPHLGVDLAAPRGTRIAAPAAGKVVFVGRKFGFGLVVEMEHGAGVKTRYAHLKEAIVHVGDDVARGTPIAAVGSSGITTGPHLHYEVLVTGRQVDPLRFRWPQAAEPEAALSTAPPVLFPAGPESEAPLTPIPGSPESISPVQTAPAPQ